MQELEYAILGGSLLISVAFLFLGLLLFSFRNSWANHPGRTVGAVQPENLGWIDLAGVGLLFVLYLFNWIEQGRVKELEAMTVPLLCVQLLFQAGFIGLIVALLFRRVNYHEFWGLKPKRVFLVIGLIYAGFILQTLILEVLWLLGFQDWTQALFVRVELPFAGEPVTMDLTYWIFWGLATVVGAPFAEEVVFRGYLYPVLKRLGGLWLASITVSIFFATIHFDGVHLMSHFVLSLILIAAYEISGSLWAPIGIHLLNNGYVFMGSIIDQ